MANRHSLVTSSVTRRRDGVRRSRGPSRRGRCIEPSVAETSARHEIVKHVHPPRGSANPDCDDRRLERGQPFEIAAAGAHVKIAARWWNDPALGPRVERNHAAPASKSSNANADGIAKTALVRGFVRRQRAARNALFELRQRSARVLCDGANRIRLPPARGAGSSSRADRRARRLRQARSPTRSSSSSLSTATTARPMPAPCAVQYHAAR